MPNQAEISYAFSIWQKKFFQQGKIEITKEYYDNKSLQIVIHKRNRPVAYLPFFLSPPIL